MIGQADCQLVVFSFRLGFYQHVAAFLLSSAPSSHLLFPLVILSISNLRQHWPSWLELLGRKCFRKVRVVAVAPRKAWEGVAPKLSEGSDARPFLPRTLIYSFVKSVAFSREEKSRSMSEEWKAMKVVDEEPLC